MGRIGNAARIVKDAKSRNMTRYSRLLAKMWYPGKYRIASLKLSRVITPVVKIQIGSKRPKPRPISRQGFFVHRRGKDEGKTPLLLLLEVPRRLMLVRPPGESGGEGVFDFRERLVGP